MGEAARANRVVLSLAHNMAQTNQITAAMIDVLTEFVHNNGITPEEGQKRLVVAVDNVPLTDDEGRMSWRDRWGGLLPHLVIWPPILVSCAYVLMFSAWTVWVWFTRSTLMPDYRWAGWRNYSSMLATRNWDCLHQPVHLRYLLRRVHHAARVAAGRTNRPAHPARRTSIARCFCTCWRFLRGHRHRLGLAAQPQHRHPEADAPISAGPASASNG